MDNEKTLSTETSRKKNSPFKLTYSTVNNLFTYILLAVGSFISLTPFLWMISTSLMNWTEAVGATVIPSELHPENYAIAWEIGQFTEYFINSVLLTLITLAGELLFSILAAYAFARIKFPGRDLIFGILLSSMMIPGMVMMIPNFLIVTWIGRIGPLEWIDNWPALTVPFMGSIFAVFLLRQFFSQIPDELFDAARIDGAGHLRYLFTVVVPLSKAPILVITVLSFIGSWNALAWPLLVTNSPDWRPIAVGFLNFVSEAGQDTHYMMAGAVITILPILFLYFITQRQFTESIARTGLKG